MTGEFPMVAMTGAGAEVGFGAIGEVELGPQMSLMVVAGLSACPLLTEPVVVTIS